MSRDPHSPCPFRREMASIVGRVDASSDAMPREASFAALSRLERQALIGGASDATLRDIAEARFLVGILRDSVRPSRPGRLRTILRARAPAPAEARPGPA